MAPDSAETPAIDPEDRDYLAYNWCSLPWSEWVPFDADRHAFHEIPREPGVYRIKPVDRDVLMYVGGTARTVHQRLQDLRMELRNKRLMPWSDPHAEAPALWAWQDAEGLRYECSAAPLDASPAGRKGMENFLLYRYRLEKKESPLCNFGRFHPRYRASTNRAAGRRGGRLDDGQQDNPAGWPGIAPLAPEGTPGDPGWMGLEWSPARPLTEECARAVLPGAGLYLLSDTATQEVVYIGQSADCTRRLADHCRNGWEEKDLMFSYQIIGPFAFPHHLRELECDLLGNFFSHFRKAPAFQYRNSR